MKMELLNDLKKISPANIALINLMLKKYMNKRVVMKNFIIFMFLFLFISVSFSQAKTIAIMSHLDDEVLWMMPYLDKFDAVYIASVPLTAGHSNIANKLSNKYLATWVPVRGLLNIRLYCDNFLNKEKGPINKEGCIVPGEYIFNKVFIVSSNGFIYFEENRVAMIDLNNGLCHGLGGDYIGKISGDLNNVYFTHTDGSIEVGKFFKQRTTKVTIKKLIRDIIADPEIDTIFTHNPWGEYGHIHHRTLSTAVRELAVEYGKNVWFPNIIITDVDGYLEYSNANLNSMTFVWKLYNKFSFLAAKKFFLEEGEKAKSMPWYQDYSIVYWTWGEDNPENYQQYILAVSNGIDFTINNEEIQYWVNKIKIYGDVIS